MDCIICKDKMDGPHNGYWFECSACGFLSSTLSETIKETGANSTIDEAYRHQALEKLRRLNHKFILKQLEIHQQPNAKKLLDVGSAHGWFLKAAAQYGYVTKGIEPDEGIISMANLEGVPVTHGFFPQDLEPSERFDIITFNDVFEHLPSPQGVLNACFEKLSSNGLLAITLPSSKGVLFLMAKLLNRLGIHGPFDRMWQRNFPSPHLSYFDPDNLSELVQNHHFHEIYRSNLNSVTTKGLWERLRYDKNAPLFVIKGICILYISNHISCKSL